MAGAGAVLHNLMEGVAECVEGERDELRRAGGPSACRIRCIWGTCWLEARLRLVPARARHCSSGFLKHADISKLLFSVKVGATWVHVR
jgi:hypothetical protein